jgi:uncharacterized protein involved in outer membrane biogenesis
MLDANQKLWVKSNTDWIKGKDLNNTSDQTSVLYRMQMDQVVRWSFDIDDFDFTQIEKELQDNAKGDT